MREFDGGFGRLRASTMGARAKSKLFEQDRTAFTMPESQRRIYLDFNATAPLRPAVRDAVMHRMVQTGNASSVHAEGRAARAAIETARAAVGALIGIGGQAVTFTSGATEAAALALTPHLSRGADRSPAVRLLVGATEHPAVARGHRFPRDRVESLRVDPDGRIDLADLAHKLASPGRSVVAVQAANGETGVLQPVSEVAALVHAAGGLLVCDAVQAVGRCDCRASALGADVVLVSAHKLGGPQGVGATIAVQDDLQFGTPLFDGGGQERGLRSGTENTAGVVGFGVAARLVQDHDDPWALLALRTRLEDGLTRIVPNVVIFGAGAPRLPNTTAFAVPGLANETALIALDLAGFAVSTGSACSSGKVSRSSVLEAMGVDPHLSAGMIRISLGWSTTPDHVDRVLEAIAALVHRVRTCPARAAA